MRSSTLQNMTHRHFPNAMHGVTATGGMHISFEWRMVRIENGSDPTLNGTIEKRLYVLKAPKGDRATMSPRPIKPEDAAREYPDEWAAFSLYGDVPVTGTALSELPGVTQSQVSYLAMHNIRSVEDLIEIGPDLASKEMGLEGSKVYKLAVAWDQKRRDAGDMPEVAAMQAKMEMAEKSRAKQDAIKDETIRQLQAQIAAFQQIQQQPASAQHAQQQSAPVQQGAAVSTVDDDDGFGYSVEDMPDPFSSGPADADPNENLTGEISDTLSEGA